MTYAVLSLVLLALAAWAAVAGARRLPDGKARTRHWTAAAITAAVLVALTAIFDNIMIAAELYEYGSEGTSGILVGLAPIEDFSYPIACAIGIPGLWLLMTIPAKGAAHG